MTDVQSGQIKRLQAERRRQAEQIERLQTALAHFGYDKEARQEGLILPSDMESLA